MFVLGQSSDTDEIKTRWYAIASCTDEISVALGRFTSLGSNGYVGYLSSADRLSDFIVTVSNVSFPETSAQLVPPEFITCGQYQGYPGPSQTGTVICSPGHIRGRYVFISLPTLGVLTMCEARVFAGRPFASKMWWYLTPILRISLFGEWSNHIPCFFKDAIIHPCIHALTSARFLPETSLKLCHWWIIAYHKSLRMSILTHALNMVLLQLI